MSGSSTLKDLLIISIFTVLIFATAESYTCIQCTEQECNTNPGTCETSQGCLNLREEFNISGQSVELLQEKGCLNDCTNLAFSATLGEERTFGYESRCCQTQQCNKDNFYFTPKSSTPNGVVCPACYSEKEGSCDTVSLQCTGLENKCIEVTGTGTLNSASFLMSGKGCATEMACSLKQFGFKNINIKIKCQEANSGSTLPTSIISSTLTGLFLLKVLL